MLVTSQRSSMLQQREDRTPTANASTSMRAISGAMGHGNWVRPPTCSP